MQSITHYTKQYKTIKQYKTYTQTTLKQLTVYIEHYKAIEDNKTIQTIQTNRIQTLYNL